MGGARLDGRQGGAAARAIPPRAVGSVATADAVGATTAISAALNFTGVTTAVLEDSAACTVVSVRLDGSEGTELRYVHNTRIPRILRI